MYLLSVVDIQLIFDLKIETFTPPKHQGPYLTSPSHGYSGPITVRTISASPRYPEGKRSKWSPLAQASYEHVGFEKIKTNVQIGAEGDEKVESLDINTGEMIGYREIQESVGIDGMRSTANEFLKRAKLVRFFLRPNATFINPHFVSLFCF